MPQSSLRSKVSKMSSTSANTATTSASMPRITCVKHAVAERIVAKSCTHDSGKHTQRQLQNVRAAACKRKSFPTSQRAGAGAASVCPCEPQTLCPGQLLEAGRKGLRTSQSANSPVLHSGQHETTGCNAAERNLHGLLSNGRPGALAPCNEGTCHTWLPAQSEQPLDLTGGSVAQVGEALPVAKGHEMVESGSPPLKKSRCPPVKQKTQTLAQEQAQQCRKTLPRLARTTVASHHDPSLQGPTSTGPSEKKLRRA
ncbi:unnamed protein product [Symbiodinium natans]|uniref:Uncharacterized protein n=1 Tax=Symbiodinium natans TaxID=878477 RepID=A0A812U6L2_9DINO|nr:unnamed protein product [Symbiodinium natans]